jgi:Rod binding domain-containing protein
VNELDLNIETAAAMPALTRPVGATGNPGELREAQKAAKDFESLLLERLLSAMKESIPSGGLLDSPASGQIQDMFWNFLGEEIGSKGGLGLWKQIYGQMNPAEAATTPGVEQLR